MCIRDSLKLSPDQPVEVLAADLRRAFSGIVAGNVKEVGIQAIEQYGPYTVSYTHLFGDIVQLFLVHA